MRILITLLLGFVFSQYVVAEEFYWRIQTGIDIRGPSHRDVFDRYLQYNWPGWYTRNIVFQGISGNTAVYQFDNSPNPQFHGGNRGAIARITRYGDSCPSGSTYDTSTGECKGPEPDKCESLKGEKFSVELLSTQYSNPFCRNGCTAGYSQGSRFGAIKDGANQKLYFSFIAEYSGTACTTEPSVVDSFDKPEPDPTSSDQTQECTATSVTTDAEGRRQETSSCTTTTTNIDNQACVDKGGSIGTVNDVMTCVNKGSGPKATETKQEVKQETKQNSDGSKAETITKTTNVTVCTGAKSCVTTTTTTTGITRTNADGSSGGSTSSCKGVNCVDGKEGDGKGDGKGEGKGDGACDPAKGYCGQGPTAQLTKGEQGSFDKGNTEWDERVSELKDDLEQKLEQYRNQFKGLFDLGFGGGGGSLPCDRTTLSHGATVSYCISDFSDSLVWFRYALLLGAAVIAAFVVLRD